MNQKPILVLGATGYIGSRLVPLLLKEGYNVRVGYRSLKKLRKRIWSNHPRVQPFKLNVFDKNSLEEAMKGCSVVYYLIHSMEASVKDFVEKDKIAAQNTILVAERMNIERIIYLGGLGEEIADQKLSKHLESRIEVAKILESCSIPVTTFRAAIIIGTGSAAFEIMRYLTNRLPIMITPRWLRTKNQPIAIENVLTYLVQTLNIPETIGETYDIGGPDIITYKHFMESYVEVAQLPKRIILPIPIFSPRISSYWIKFITGIPSSLARPLIDGMKNEVVVKDTRIQKIIPQRLIGHKEAIYKALNPDQYNQIFPMNRKSEIPSEWYHPGDVNWSGGVVFQDHRIVVIRSPIRSKIPTIREILVRNKSLYLINVYLRIGSLIDQLFNGKIHFSRMKWKLSKDRGDSVQLKSNDYLPGHVLLTYKVLKTEQQVQLHQVFRIIPKGMLGTGYWFIMKPFFQILSNNLILNIANSFQGSINENIRTIQHFSKPYVRFPNSR